MRIERACAIVCVAILTSCAAIKLEPGAQQVRIVTNEPPACEYLGAVTGNQGELLHGWVHEQCELRDGRAKRHEKPGA
jgi:hypothetical protein